jgi:hypothetical protein
LSQTPSVRPSGLVKKGDYNKWIGVVGVPGTGKSTYALGRAIIESKGAYVIGHTAGTLPDVLPNGKRANTRYHSSIQACAEAFKKDPRGVNIIDAEVGDILSFAEDVAAQSLEAHDGTHGTPVLVFVDEVVAAEDMSPYRLNPTMRKLNALRRHKNIGILFTSQTPQFCHYSMFSMATEIVFFQVLHEDALKIFSKLGVPRDIVARIPTLSRNKHEYIVWNPYK